MWIHCVSIHVPVDSFHGNCHIHHFDLKLSLILLFKSRPPLEIFSDFPLISKNCLRPPSPPVSSGPGCIGELLGNGHCSCPHTHLVFQRHTACVFHGALCLSPEALWLCVSSWSCVMWLCCVVLGHAFKPQNFWVLIANWKGKTAWIISRKTVRKTRPFFCSSGQSTDPCSVLLWNKLVNSRDVLISSRLVVEVFVGFLGAEGDGVEKIFHRDKNLERKVMQRWRNSLFRQE